MSSYEAHITFPGSDWEKLKEFAKEGDWKPSLMVNDPVLGDGEYCYLTAHSDDHLALAAKVGAISALAHYHGLTVKRMKIEQDVWDERF